MRRPSLTRAPAVLEPRPSSFFRTEAAAIAARRSLAMKTRPLAVASILALAAAGGVHARSGASGSVTADGATWKIADAVAVSEDGDVEIWFSKLEFDRAAW